MKAILSGAALGILLVACPATLPLAGAALAQPAVLGCVLGVLARPAIARHIRRWVA